MNEHSSGAGSDAPAALQRAAPGQPPGRTFGLRDEEISAAKDIVTDVLPCMHLFQGRLADGSDLYETLADMFTVLQVRAVPALHTL